MQSELIGKLERALEFEGTVLPYKHFPMFVLEYDENHEQTEKAKIVNEYLNAGLKFAHLKPLHEKLIECVRALEWISGRDEEKPYCTYYERYLDDGSVVPTTDDVAEKALAALAKACE